MKAIYCVTCLLWACLAASPVLAESGQASSSAPGAADAPAASAAPAKAADKAKAKAKPAAAAKAKKKPAAKTASRKKADAVAADVPEAKLDLTLPKDMVHDLQPPGQVRNQVPPTRKTLLPALFAEKPAADTPFQLNGRLLNNEMQLQMRNESRRDVEGAALDFEFKQ
ncbi:translation initiation factor 2 [Pseudomonas sp. nanlin1]|uniref:translation initiation factor 2 n=1 Tax=Pseudomonas sp. nanlin1 TaxID=3040605 RepID=UPI00388FE829